MDAAVKWYGSKTAAEDVVLNYLIYKLIAPLAAPYNYTTHEIEDRARDYGRAAGVNFSSSSLVRAMFRINVMIFAEGRKIPKKRYLLFEHTKSAEDLIRIAKMRDAYTQRDPRLSHCGREVTK